jgi:hypothetical protein
LAGESVVRNLKTKFPAIHAGKPSETLKAYIFENKCALCYLSTHRTPAPENISIQVLQLRDYAFRLEFATAMCWRMDADKRFSKDGYSLTKPHSAC